MHELTTSEQEAINGGGWNWGTFWNVVSWLGPLFL